jgi:hypothetical protein
MLITDSVLYFLPDKIMHMWIVLAAWKIGRKAYTLPTGLLVFL